MKHSTIINKIKMLETFSYLELDFLAFGSAADNDLDDDKGINADDDSADPEFGDADVGDDNNSIEGKNNAIGDNIDNGKDNGFINDMKVMLLLVVMIMTVILMMIAVATMVTMKLETEIGIMMILTLIM